MEKIKFDGIDKTLKGMTKNQLRLTLEVLALWIQRHEIVDKIDYVDAVRLGKSVVEELKDLNRTKTVAP